MILLAVSGGIDSMYMANRAIEQSRDFAVAHCNFCLRGEDSDGDEAFVRDWCSEHDIRLFIKRFDTSGYADSHGVSIEMAARELRYAWFAELCSEEGFEAVAVAHNANDNAETLLLNMLRGTGSKGLRGMAPVSTRSAVLRESDSECPPFEIRRPLLDTTREEIRAWMTGHGHTWREDRTNAQSDCKRNIIRNEVFPILARINPSFIRTLNRDMAHFAGTDSIAEDYYREALEALGCTGGIDDGVNITVLLSMKHWKYVIWRILEPFRFSEETFDKLTALLESGRTISGKTFQSPTHLAGIRRKRLFVEERKK